MCPSEGVQTIFVMYYQHAEEIFSNLESIQASQAESSGCPQLGPPGWPGRNFSRKFEN